MKPLISFIVPIYKIEELFLRECIESLINQTYKNNEIILIDDGSPDNCPEICDEYASIDNVIVIHKTNAGTAAARNTGLERARGDYICFVDGDDRLENNAIETVLQHIHGCPDIIWFDAYVVTNSGKEVWRNKPRKSSCQFKDALCDFLLNNHIQSCWGKLISRKTIGDTRLNESLNRGQDEEFVIRLLLKEGESETVNVIGYDYNIRTTSATNKSFNLKVFNINVMTRIAKEEITEVYPELSKYADTYIVNGLWNILVQYKKSRTVDEKLSIQLQSLLNEKIRAIIKSNIPARQKMIFLLSILIGVKNTRIVYLKYLQRKVKQ